MTRPVKTATLGGQRWRFQTGHIDGLCEHDTQTITVSGGLGPRATLETIIHEALHAQRPGDPEEAIACHARELAALLHRLGYRA